MKGLVKSALVVSTLVGAVNASAAVVSYTSDADFLANAAFTKSFGANARWGNSATNGDWEYAVVNAADVPIGVSGQLNWYNGNNLHSYGFDYDGLTTARFDIDGDGASPVTTGNQTVSPLPSINALAIRARANAGDIAQLTSMTVLFDLGGSVNLGSLVGDGNAEYIMLIDSRLAGGFSIGGNAQVQDGSGSLPMYGFKVGVSTVPVPAAAWLFGSAMLGLVSMGRRRQG